MAKRVDPIKWLVPEALAQIREWAENGLNVKDIAVNMGISRSTLYVWSDKYSDILDALTRGRGVADRVVKNKAFLSAIGYDVDETECREVLDKNGKIVTLKSTRTRHIPADVRAQQFWLVNRCPSEWRSVNHAAKDDGVHEDSGGVIEITAVAQPAEPPENGQEDN